MIESFTVVMIPPGKTAADIGPRSMRRPARIVDAIAKALDSVRTSIPRSRRRWSRQFASTRARRPDKAIATGPELASALTHQLQEVSHDRHVRVEWLAQTAPPRTASRHEGKAEAQQLERTNCGFVKTERLDGNIGYIKFDMFGPTDVAARRRPRRSPRSAMSTRSSSICARRRGARHGRVCQSYLFAKRTDLTTSTSAKRTRRRQSWTNPDVPGKKLATQPVFVLTSARTFSAAEAFSLRAPEREARDDRRRDHRRRRPPGAPGPLDDHFTIVCRSRARSVR